jgi:hypothetical protein
MIPDYSTIGGVAEAACWLCLREDIYVSSTTQTPIKTVLDCFSKSASILRNDDYSWASQSILNLALLLQSAFCKPRNALDMVHAEAQISKWEVSKPTSYKPIYFKARSREKDSCFPEVWMLLSRGLDAASLPCCWIAVLSHSADRFERNRTPRDNTHT